jgi:predicted rRNA methylase YqxC with S4 and FtsJ domains
MASVKAGHRIARAGFERLRVIPSPITGTDGNREFLALARRMPKSAAPAEQDLPSEGK